MEHKQKPAAVIEKDIELLEKLRKMLSNQETRCMSFSDTKVNGIGMKGTVFFTVAHETRAKVATASIIARSKAMTLAVIDEEIQELKKQLP
jgi:hypothetical protein